MSREARGRSRSCCSSIPLVTEGLSSVMTLADAEPVTVTCSPIGPICSRTFTSEACPVRTMMPGRSNLLKPGTITSTR